MKFVSLFAGIGGFDLALERLGFECVYANDFDKYCKIIYDKHFGQIHRRNGEDQERDERSGTSQPGIQTAKQDILNGGNSSDSLSSGNTREVSYYDFKQKGLDTRSLKDVPTTDIPEHDLLVGGFPCQAFSIAGKRRGFEDIRGTLFFDVARILRDKRPRYFILENVKGLLNHDGGKTISTIFEVLSELGYIYSWRVHNSKNHGVPQNRERIYIVGHTRESSGSEVFPFGKSGLEHDEPEDETRKDGERIRGQNISATIDANYYKGAGSNRQMIQVVGSLSSEKWDKFHESNRRVYSPDGISPTIPTSAGGGHLPKILAPKTEYGNGERSIEWHETDIAPTIRATQAKRGDNEIRVIQDVRGMSKKSQNGKGYRDGDSHSYTVDTKATQGILREGMIRRLTPIECERLQGFPDNWTEGVSDTQRYKMCGNAVTVNVIYDIAKELFGVKDA